MKELLVEKSKIKNNLKIINNIINKNGKNDNGEKVKLIAVVKGSGYGLDLVQYSKFLADNGVKMFAVATVEEALELRRGGIKEDILMMSSTAVKEDIQKMLDKNIILTIGSKEAGDAVNELAQNKKARVHLKIDTGFGRYGFIYNEKEKMVENIKQWNNIQIEGTFSHFSLAFFGNGKEAQEQFSRFIDCVAVLKKEKIDTGMLHICNSSAFLRFTNMYLNAVRIGSALLGRLSIPNTWGFQRVGILKSNVAEIKTLPKGYNIGYSNSYQTKKETKVAVVPCGYADGFNVIVDKDMFRKRDKIRYIVRDIKNAFKQQQIFVKINGEKFKVLGRLGMFHVTVDITGKNINIGDEVMFEVSPMLVDSKIERKYI